MLLFEKPGNSLLSLRKYHTLVRNNCIYLLTLFSACVDVQGCYIENKLYQVAVFMRVYSGIYCNKIVRQKCDIKTCLVFQGRCALYSMLLSGVTFCPLR